ncbi:hypothetical protein D3C78_1895610 [compost metagenome]
MEGMQGINPALIKPVQIAARLPGDGHGRKELHKQAAAIANLGTDKVAIQHDLASLVLRPALVSE